MAAQLYSQGDAIACYARMRGALELYGELPDALTATQQQTLAEQQARERLIQQRILQAPQARQVVVPREVVEQAISTLAERFDNADTFADTLAHNGLDRHGLYLALEHELRVEAALEQILAEESRISDTELEIYYLQHLERFTLPETRTARQILITLNDDYAENTREQAHARLSALSAQIHSEADFRRLAERHSECPSAMHEGRLGRIKPGQLFPALEKVLFALEEGALSAITESPVGLHLLWCEAIHPAETLPFTQVRDKLRDHLEQNARKRHLKRWLQQAAL